MKHQYFGDDRDIFKFDLVQRICEDKDLSLSFFYIPMLTEDIALKRPGQHNTDLVKFLHPTRKTGEIKRYFEENQNHKIETTIYPNYTLDSYITAQNRDTYFEGIKIIPNRSLILLDPDTGLESDISRPTKAHVLYENIQTVYDKMDHISIMMVFQWFPRNKTHECFLHDRSLRLCHKCENQPVLYVCDSKISFFFLTKRSLTRKTLSKLLFEYHVEYDHLKTNCVVGENE